MENIPLPLPARVPLDDARHYVLLWRQSGLTRRRFCEHHHIPFAKLRNWTQRVDSADRHSHAPRFIPAQLSIPAAGDERIELCLPGDIHLRCSTAQLPAVLLALHHVAP
ncbi:IS66 family insertion sequence element accessory protein TnpB [Salmonella enterica]|nr:IS66 family insertion sequence element accessory protein TnpB [Salmonella enterica]HCM1853311.1 IS66 family insertion sequence element accessory protein TnpB [Salmonella enterica subsp. salamae serovar 42:z29:-]EAY8297362.1 IS66 family insertion sequence element accessory protein TnpB [Salmonella enterica]EAY8607888.1 IS66 family insertion sequence element accessory protein TnpB [Salmonella enterica]EEP0951994.1 IS66 family insertion sequence element accessory protein TnpB [Salmonella enteri